MRPLMAIAMVWVGTNIVSTQTLAQAIDTKLLALLADTLPRAGIVECTLVRDDGEIGVYGFELGTGLWYEVRSETGRANLGETTLYWSGGSDESRERAGTLERNLWIERYTMPFIWLRQVVDHPSCITRLQASDGGTVLEFQAPRGDPTGGLSGTSAAFRLRISGNGSLVSAEHVGTRAMDEMHYLGQAAPGYPIAVTESGTWTLRSATVRSSIPGVKPFTRAYVDRRTDEIRRPASESRFKRARESKNTDLGPPLAPGTIPGTDPYPSAALPLPLGLVGALLIGLGVFMWRRYK
jgi:hypothetical protein